MKKTYVVLGVIILFCLLSGYVGWNVYRVDKPIDGLITPITTFDPCVAAGYAVQESNPARCVTREGEVFTSLTDLGNSTTSIPTVDSTSTKASFGILQALTVGKAATFTDGLLVTLKEVTDSRCPQDVVCVWAGEQGVLLTISGGDVGVVREVRLGMVTMSTLTQSGYIFTLGSVTTNKVTVTVTKNAGVTTGSVSGMVKIGPICPVESIDNPCVVSPEVYTSRSVVVYQADTTTVIKRQPLSATGTYNLALSPATYWLQIDPAGIGEGEKKRVVVTSGNTSVIDFDIDTGIR